METINCNTPLGKYAQIFTNVISKLTICFSKRACHTSCISMRGWRLVTTVHSSILAMWKHSHIGTRIIPASHYPVPVQSSGSAWNVIFISILTCSSILPSRHISFGELLIIGFEMVCISTGNERNTFAWIYWLGTQPPRWCPNNPKLRASPSRWGQHPGNIPHPPCAFI